MVSLAAPFLGGLIIGLSGFDNAFFLAAFILLVAILPLYYFPKHKVSAQLNAKELYKQTFNKKLGAYNFSNFGYAAEFIVGAVIWKLFLFLSIGSIEKFGGIISLGLLVSAIVTFVAGMLSDNGERKKVLARMSGLTSIIWFFRSTVTTVFSATLSHIFLHLTYPALIVAWASQFYDLSKKSDNPTAFILGRETITNLARLVFIPILMLLSVSVTQTQFFSISFIIAGAVVPLFIFANKQSADPFKKAPPTP